MIFRNRALMGAALCLLALIIFLLAHVRTDSMHSFLHTSFSTRPQTAVIPLTTHIVLFKFKDDATPVHLKDITLRMLGLQKSCVHPETGARYIKSITGGKDNSPEGLQEGLTHGFVVQFSSKEDRDYYVNQDPAHEAFKDIAGPFIEKAVVFDFQEGVFMHTGSEPIKARGSFNAPLTIRKASELQDWYLCRACSWKQITQEQNDSSKANVQYEHGLSNFKYDVTALKPIGKGIRSQDCGTH